MLIETGNREIGEASLDPKWGIGLSLSNPDTMAREKWTGDNLMGKILMKIRNELSDA